jgi:hypothetical protein
MMLSIPISPGELLDKISILEIKVERIADPVKQANVRSELSLLSSVQDTLPQSSELAALAAELKAVNERLWDVEDAIRECDRRADFGAEFIRLARSVYIENDRRAALKRRVNELLGSPLIEEKSYAKRNGE